MFAAEIVEKILSYCDGKTLLNCLDVDEVFNNGVKYLTKSTDIWECCCKKEIPRNELEDYIQKYTERGLFPRGNWCTIYENWVKWQNIHDNIQFSYYKSLVDVPRVSCVSSVGRFIAVGSEDGRIRVFNRFWELVGLLRFASGKVTDIRYLMDANKSNPDVAVILVAYNNGETLFATHALGSGSEPYLTYQNIINYSTFGNCICAIRRGGRITVDEIIHPFDEGTGKKELIYVRIFSQNEVTACNIWRGVCTFLLHNEVRVLDYRNNDLVMIKCVEHKMYLNFLKSKTDCTKFNYIFRDDIIIILNDENYGEVMELFVLGSKEILVHKTFRSWEIMHSIITYLYLYGNTLLIGDNSGMVSFYEIKSWKDFDLKNYQSQIFLGPHPILSIDAVETVNGRIFYIASSFKVHVVECHSLSRFAITRDFC